MMIHQRILAQQLQVPRPAPDAPGPFRFAEPGSLAQALRAAGFQQVEEETHRLTLAWPGPPATWWQQTQDVAAPLRGLLARLTPEQRAQVDHGVEAALQPSFDGDQLTLVAVVHVATGER